MATNGLLGSLTPEQINRLRQLKYGAADADGFYYTPTYQQRGSGTMDDPWSDGDLAGESFTRRAENDQIDVWNADGTYKGRVADGKITAQEALTYAALLAGASYAASGIAGAGAGGAAAGTGAGMTAAESAALMAANGMTDAQIAAALGSAGAQSAGLTGVGGGLSAGGWSLGGSEAFGAGLGEGATLTGGSTLTGGTPVFGTTLADAGIGFGGMGAYAPVAGAVGGAAAGGGAAGGATSGAGGSLVSSLVNGAKDVMGSNTGSLIGAGLGAVAGAIDSQDKEQTQSREPWKAAQPFLQQLLSQGQQLSTQYQQQPFSQAQRTAYGNMGGLMDSINSQVPGLLGTFNANASGQNQFVRGAPRQLQGGGANFSGYMPGLLGNFGT